MNMGQSLIIKGELSGGEDLTLDGRVEGKVSLPDHVLTVGANAKLDAEIVAKVVIVLGSVHGNVTAREKFELKAGGAQALAHFIVQDAGQAGAFRLLGVQSAERGIAHLLLGGTEGRNVERPPSGPGHGAGLAHREHGDGEEA